MKHGYQNEALLNTTVLKKGRWSSIGVQQYRGCTNKTVKMDGGSKVDILSLLLVWYMSYS